MWATRALQPLLAAALLRLGTRRALVVHGDDGLDEVTLATTTRVIDTAAGHLRPFRWGPADFGLPSRRLADIRVSGPEASAAMIRGVFQGQTGPARDIVVANAAAARLDRRSTSIPGGMCLPGGGSHRPRGRRRPPGPARGTDASPLTSKKNGGRSVPKSAPA